MPLVTTNWILDEDDKCIRDEKDFCCVALKGLREDLVGEVFSLQNQADVE